MKLSQTLTSFRLHRDAHNPLWYSYEVALNWLVVNRLPGAGIPVAYANRTSYPEVTGYTIPTLLEAGETALAHDLARWLISVQRPDGGFAGPDGSPYLFDTGQVLRGLLAVAADIPEARTAIRKAADWMLASADTDGIIRPEPSSPWSQRFGARISENIHLYALPPLLEAGRLLAEPRYEECVRRSLDYYASKPDLLHFTFLTHFYGYVLEALVDLGRDDLARIGLQPIIAAQRPDGAIPAVPGAAWVCSPGALQLAIVGYKLGLTTFADAAVDYLQSLQTPSGGFFGSYGPSADYGPNDEPSWACKYFLDACHWRFRQTFDQQQFRFPAEIAPTDPRLSTVLDAIGDVAGKRVLDVGCGRGPFLRVLQQLSPTAELSGVDVSAEVLKHVPVGVETRQASMLNLPFADASFDVVLCIEALEHAIRVERAVSELCRVLKPGGRIVIIDKNIQRLGRLPIEEWERWFDPDDVAQLLSHFCTAVSHQRLRASDGTPEDTLFVAWIGTRMKEAQPQVSLSRAVPQQELRGYRSARRYAHARALVNQGFARYQQQDRVGARQALLSGVRHDMSWLKNRGVLSILLESVIGPKASNALRTITHPQRARVDEPRGKL